MIVPIMVPTAINAILKDSAFPKSFSPMMVVIHIIGVGINEMVANRHNIKTAIAKILNGSEDCKPLSNGAIRLNSNKIVIYPTKKHVPIKPINNTGLIFQLSDTRPQNNNPPTIEIINEITIKSRSSIGMVTSVGISSITNSRIGMKNVPNDIMAENAIQ